MQAGVSDAHICGLSLHHWREAYRRQLGDDRLAALEAALPADTRAALEAGLRLRGWYPLAWFRACCATAREQNGGDREIIEQLARSSARAEFTGFHRVLFLFVSPHRLLRQASRVWERYYDVGDMTVDDEGRGRARAHWRACTGFDANLWLDAFAATAVALEVCGAKDVRWELESGGTDDSVTATVAYLWR